MLRSTLSQTQPEISELSADDLDRVSGGEGLRLLVTISNIQASQTSESESSQLLNNISKTRAEISMTFARNARA